MLKTIDITTDTKYTVNLDSTIVYTTWKAVRAYGGRNTEIEVRTAFVGDGAAIKITVYGEESGELVSIEDKVFSNRYIADIPIPENVKIDEKVFFIAKLSKHGLEAQSTKIPAVSPIKMVKIGWGQQVANRGDIVDIKAELLGLRDIVPCEVLVFEYDQDGNHDLINRIPTQINKGKLNLQWEYEYHEDTDEITTEDEMQEYGKHYNPPEYFFIVEIDGQRFGEEQESGLLEFKDWVEYLVNNCDNSYNCVITFSDGSKRSFNNVTNSIVRCEQIQPGKCSIDFT